MKLDFPNRNLLCFFFSFYPHRDASWYVKHSERVNFPDRKFRFSSENFLERSRSKWREKSCGLQNMIRLKTIAAFVRPKTFNFTSQLIHSHECWLGNNDSSGWAIKILIIIINNPNTLNLQPAPKRTIKLQLMHQTSDSVTSQPELEGDHKSI